ncbi:MAG: hypothetical protein A2167_08370 [Planctomycetes bacterium RBG_13_46_10]|nr:MAG: hypothetical protein A2167_08370 [Planctomycetes bacterium RBG_13_46_10]
MSCSEREKTEMSLVEINWQPKRKELRNFGIIALIASIVISLLFYIFKGLEIKWILIICAIGFAIFLISCISGKISKIIYLGLILVTLPIGWMVSLILLSAFYFLLLTPIGLIFRLMGRDLLCRKFDSSADSYWLPRRQPDSSDRYFHQF